MGADADLKHRVLPGLRSASNGGSRYRKIDVLRKSLAQSCYKFAIPREADVSAIRNR